MCTYESSLLHNAFPHALEKGNRELATQPSTFYHEYKQSRFLVLCVFFSPPFISAPCLASRIVPPSIRDLLRITIMSSDFYYAFLFPQIRLLLGVARIRAGV